MARKNSIDVYWRELYAVAMLKLPRDATGHVRTERLLHSGGGGSRRNHHDPASCVGSVGRHLLPANAAAGL
jgi:hypothetical protein